MCHFPLEPALSTQPHERSGNNPSQVISTRAVTWDTVVKTTLGVGIWYTLYNPVLGKRLENEEFKASLLYIGSLRPELNPNKERKGRSKSQPLQKLKPED